MYGHTRTYGPACELQANLDGAADSAVGASRSPWARDGGARPRSEPGPDETVSRRNGKPGEKRTGERKPARLAWIPRLPWARSRPRRRGRRFRALPGAAAQQQLRQQYLIVVYAGVGQFESATRKRQVAPELRARPRGSSCGLIARAHCCGHGLAAAVAAAAVVCALGGGRLPGLAESPSRPSRESLKTPSRAESRVALNKTESLNIGSCYDLAV